MEKFRRSGALPLVWNKLCTTTLCIIDKHQLQRGHHKIGCIFGWTFWRKRNRLHTRKSLGIACRDGLAPTLHEVGEGWVWVVQVRGLGLLVLFTYLFRELPHDISRKRKGDEKLHNLPRAGVAAHHWRHQKKNPATETNAIKWDSVSLNAVRWRPTYYKVPNSRAEW
jgi:hypothetical protein